MNDNLLTVSAHPDDWELGCYATIERVKREGAKVHHLVLGGGRDGRFDNQFDRKPLLYWIKQIEAKIAECKPSIIFTHYVGDLNIDHQITCKAVMTAARPIYECCSVDEIYSFEVLSSTEWGDGFEPDFFVRVTEEDVMQKQRYLEKYYPKEMREYPHPRSTEGILNMAMGRGMQCGTELAEAFMTIRRII